MKSPNNDQNEQSSEKEMRKESASQQRESDVTPSPKNSSEYKFFEELKQQFKGLLLGNNPLEGDMFNFAPPRSGEVRRDNQKEAKKDVEEEEEKRHRKITDRIRHFSRKPREIRDYLNRFVIKQEEAKKVLSVAICDHYNHVRRCLDNAEELQKDYSKPNVLLLGPTGVGKTYLIRNIAKLIGVPFVKADATKFSETGYVGNDVEDLVRDLVRAADGNAELAQYGIVFIDEVDKIATSGEMGRDVSGRGVQVNLLKIMEDSDVNLIAPNDLVAQMNMMMNFGNKTRKETINTRHILFIMSGAFDKLGDIIRRRLDANTIGFGHPGKNESNSAYLHQAATEDFINFGMEPEFVGRLPVRVACDALQKEDLSQILTASEGSILRQYEQDFDGYGIRIEVTADAIDEIAARAATEKTGARGLMTVLERLFREFKFHLPSTNVTYLPLHRETVKNPQETLDLLLSHQ